LCAPKESTKEKPLKNPTEWLCNPKSSARMGPKAIQFAHFWVCPRASQFDYSNW
jgi:hypothetical protein